MMHSKKFTLFSILFSMLLTAGCNRVKSSYDFDSNVDFTQVKTWQWDKTTSAEFTQANPLIDKRIIKAIEGNLVSKGIKQSTPADINVSYSISIEEKLSSGGVNIAIGMSLRATDRGSVSLSRGNHQLTQTKEGTLTIDMTSAKDGALLWRSTGMRSLPHAASSPEKSQAKITEAVNEMLENFPPPRKNAE